MPLISLQDINGTYQLFDPDELLKQLAQNEGAEFYGMSLKVIDAVRGELLALDLTMPVDVKDIKKIFANIKGRRQTLSDAIKQLQIILLDPHNTADDLDAAEMFVQDNEHFIIEGSGADEINDIEKGVTKNGSDAN